MTNQPDPNQQIQKIKDLSRQITKNLAVQRKHHRRSLFDRALERIDLVVHFAFLGFVFWIMAKISISGDIGTIPLGKLGSIFVAKEHSGWVGLVLFLFFVLFYYSFLAKAVMEPFGFSRIGATYLLLWSGFISISVPLQYIRGKMDQMEALMFVGGYFAGSIIVCLCAWLMRFHLGLGLSAMIAFFVTGIVFYAI